MAVSLISLFKGASTKAYVAMTGEITLRGRVLPVGGIKEKVLAAKRAGITTVILPKRNEKDLVEVPEKAKEKMIFKFVEKVDEMLPLVFGTEKQTKEIKKKELSSVH
jgi:ATP-dependent Lon protease